MLASLLFGLGIGLAVWNRRGLRGTTLIAPWNWLVTSLTVVAAVEWIASTVPAASYVEPLRFVATTSTFCPLMALLGAKRPQNRGWQFVVLAFWIMLALPAGERILLRPGPGMELRELRAGFLVLLMLLGALNSCATRFWPAAVLYSAGQGLLAGRFLPIAQNVPTDWGGHIVATSLGLFVVALALVVWLPSRTANCGPLDRLWRDFRDMFGLLWGLRLAERVNAAAEQHGWPVRLRWPGFYTLDGHQLNDELTVEQRRALYRVLNNLLRRFVSQTWIAGRLGEQVD